MLTTPGERAKQLGRCSNAVDAYGLTHVHAAWVVQLDAYAYSFQACSWLLDSLLVLLHVETELERQRHSACCIWQQSRCIAFGFV